MSRTAAARLFSVAVARVAETKAAWGRSEAKGQRARAGAVEDLLGSGMELGEVTELLGISTRELHSLCATRPQRPTEAGSPMNGSVQSKRNARTWRAEPGLHGRMLGEYGRLCSRQS